MPAMPAAGEAAIDEPAGEDRQGDRHRHHVTGLHTEPEGKLRRGVEHERHDNGHGSEGEEGEATAPAGQCQGDDDECAIGTQRKQHGHVGHR